MDPILSTAQHAVLEIGCGHGHWLTAYATAHPATTCIGLDIISQRVAKSQLKATKRQLNNLHFIKAEAIEFIEILPPSVSFDWIMVLFPDPWPKKRQQKRRLIQKPFTSLLASKLSKGGYIYCVTDWEEYAYQMLDVLGSTEGLENPYQGFCPAVTWRDTTKFEKKGLEKHHPINEVWFEKQ